MRLEVEDIATIVLLRGLGRRQVEGQAEHEGSPYVVKALRHPDLRRFPIGGIRLAAATIERPTDPHGERRLHRDHRVRQRRHSQYLGESRVVVGAVRVLAEGHGILVDQQPRVDRRIRRRLIRDLARLFRGVHNRNAPWAVTDFDAAQFLTRFEIDNGDVV